METFLWACVGLGGLVLVAQIVASFFGMDADIGSFDADPSDGLDLFSVRSLAAGVAFFGVGSLVASGPMQYVVGFIVGLGAMVVTAWMTRAMLKLESNGQVDYRGVVGQMGRVYLTVPAGRAGIGKVNVELQGRRLEMRAVTSSDVSVPTGASVVIVGFDDAGTVEVVPTPIPGE